MFVILLQKVKSTGFYFQKVCLHLLKTATGASKNNKNVRKAPWQIHCYYLENRYFQVHQQNTEEDKGKETLQKVDNSDSNEKEIEDENNSNPSPMIKSSSKENVSLEGHSSISVSNMYDL